LSLNKEKEDKSSKPYSEEFEAFDGLTPPTHNIRKRRFRKIPQYEDIDVHRAEDEINRQMNSGPGTQDSDISYEAVPVEDIEAIYDLPSGVTVVLMKEGPPFKSGLVGVPWTQEEISVLGSEHRSRLEAAGSAAFADEDDDELEDDGDALPDIPIVDHSAARSAVSMPAQAQPAGNSSASNSNILRLRIAKIDLTKKYNEKTQAMKKLTFAARNERNSVMKQRLDGQIKTTNEEIEAIKIEMTTLDADLAKLGAA